MKNLFNNSVTRFVRDEVNDRLKKPNEQKPESQSSKLPSAPPTYYHHPSSTTTITDSYSHTANSTAGYPQSSSYPILTNYNQEREPPTILQQLETKATDLIDNLVQEGAIVSATNKLNSVFTNGHTARELLRSGAIVQFASKSSGRLLQVVMSSNGVLVFDGDGARNSFNTYFTVEEGEKGRLRFHNNCNYLSFDGKQPCISSLPPGPKNNSQIDFRVHDILGSSEFIAFESCSSKNCFISILNDGHLKTTNLKDKNVDTQFSVIPVPLFPYQTPTFPQYQMNVGGGFPPNGPSGYAPSQPAMCQIQPSAPPPPPLYSAQDPYTQPSASSNLYPQFH